MTTMEPLTVELPTCPTCGLASKVSVETYSGKSFCAGRKGARHKKIRMEIRTFREVREDEGASS